MKDATLAIVDVEVLCEFLQCIRWTSIASQSVADHLCLSTAGWGPILMLFHWQIEFPFTNIASAILDTQQLLFPWHKLWFMLWL